MSTSTSAATHATTPESGTRLLRKIHSHFDTSEPAPTAAPEVHAFECNCDECCETLWLSIMEDRA